MTQPLTRELFEVEPGHPLANEHAVVSAFIEEALRSLGEAFYYQDLPLKTVPSGEVLLAGNPEQARRYVKAAVAQVEYWDQMVEKVRSQARNDMERMNAHFLPGWTQVWGRRRQAEAVIGALMRRTLPFQQKDLLELIHWCCKAKNLTTYSAPISLIVRALQRFVKDHELDTELREALTQLATTLRSSQSKDAKRFGTAVEQLCATGQPEPTGGPERPTRPPAQPGPAGTSHVLAGLKRSLGMLPHEPDPPAAVIGPDAFTLRTDSPLWSEHELLCELLQEIVDSQYSYHSELDKFPAGTRLLSLDSDAKGRALLAATERHVSSLQPDAVDAPEHSYWQSRSATGWVVAALMQTDFRLTRDGLFDLLLYLALRPRHEHLAVQQKFLQLIQQVEQAATDSPLTEGERFVLSLLRVSLISGPSLGATAPTERLTRLIQDGAAFYLVPGEAWTDALNADIAEETAEKRSAWVNLLKHALTATAARPSAKWLKTTESLLKAIGVDQVGAALLRWFPLVAQGQTVIKLGQYAGDTRGSSDTIQEENANCLRALLWCVPLLPQKEELARVVTTVALSAYKKVPGVGPRAVKVGNAAVYALSELASKEAVGQLAMLKVRVKFGTAQKEIEKAFDAAAAALDLPRDQIEELGVPSYGMDSVGRRCEEFGGYRAELHVTGSDAELRWFDANGKSLKSVPAKVKSEHKEDLKELQQSLKDIQSMLPAQRDRIDGMFLLQKSWPIAEWRERYHDHPLVGTIARRLLWCVDGTPARFCDGQPTDVHGSAIAHGKTAEIQLWHPVGRSIDEITGWRRRLEELKLTQPFKQAHREIYLLTDAERNTRTYSNRFAAHVLRQHQFNALCAARGWKNKLRLMVDDTYPPAIKELPQWDLRAEFWIEGVGDTYGVDTNDAGSYLRLATDQVRFYRLQATVNYAHAGGGGYGSAAAGPGQDNVNEPLPLADVPELVFSEIMRDVDLFVGVASVGNDPTWQDGGPDGRYRAYWQRYSFGELSGTATTRKQVLERLVPRLKIASRCSFSDRFLVVRGDLRTYKIHLGSGNILMEPNDQYLCIVPDARQRATKDDLYLPFEGDSTLSIIISKALLLAEDRQIKDPSITRQIETK